MTTEKRKKTAYAAAAALLAGLGIYSVNHNSGPEDSVAEPQLAVSQTTTTEAKASEAEVTGTAETAAADQTVDQLTEEARAGAEAEVLRLEGEVARLEGEITDLTDDLSADDSAGELATVKASLEETNSTLDDTTAKLEETVAKLEYTTKLAEDRQARIDRLTEIVAERDATIADLNKALDKLAVPADPSTVAQLPGAEKVLGDETEMIQQAALSSPPARGASPADAGAPDLAIPGSDSAIVPDMKEFELALAAAKEAATTEASNMAPPLSQVHFESGSSSLTIGGQTRALAAAAALSGMDVQKIRITGHTDTTGSPDVNRRIATARAQAVADILIKSGVDAGAIEIIALGESSEALPIHTANGISEPLNRCVGIYPVMNRG